MATDPLTARFPNVSFSCGTNPSRVLGFDFPSGIDGAYDVLGLSEGDAEEVVLGKMRTVLKSKLRAWHRALPTPCTSLGAISIIAASRARPRGNDASQNVCPYDSILGQLYAFELLSLLTLFQLPVPGGASRWSKDNSSTSPILLPTSFLDWGYDESDGSFFPNIASAVHNGRANEVELWSAGTLDDDDEDSGGSLFASLPDRSVRPILFHSSSSSAPSGDAPASTLFSGAGATKGLVGISRAQLGQLKRGKGGGTYFLPPVTAGVPSPRFFSKRSSARAKKKGKEKEEGKEEETTTTTIAVRKCDELEKGQRELQQKQEQIEVELERMRELVRLATQNGHENNRRPLPNVDAGVQVDLVPTIVPNPIIITRPSSPLYLPTPAPFHDKDDAAAGLASQLEALQKKAEALQKTVDEQQQELTEKSYRYAQLELRHQAVSRVVDTVQPFLRPLAQRAYSAVPLPRIVKDVLFDRAERFLLGDGRVEGAGQGVVCETDEVVEVKRRTSVKAASTDSHPSPPPPTLDPLILPHLRLSRPSDRATFVVERFRRRVEELSGRLRTKTDENVDLLVQLAHLALKDDDEKG